MYVLKNKGVSDECWNIVGIFTSIDEIEKAITIYGNSTYGSVRWKYEYFEQVNHIY